MIYPQMKTETDPLLLLLLLLLLTRPERWLLALPGDWLLLLSGRGISKQGCCSQMGLSEMDGLV